MILLNIYMKTEARRIARFASRSLEHLLGSMSARDVCVMCVRTAPKTKRWY